MLTKMSVIVLIVASLQIALSFGYTTLDDESAKKICEAPASPGKGRVRMTGVSTGGSFLSGGVKSVPTVCLGNGQVYRYEVEEPSKDDKVMNAARQKIGETSPEAVETAKKQLVELLKKDTKINAPLDNSEWLVRFLRLRDYDVTAAYKLIKNYYNFKAQNQKVLQGLRSTTESELVGSNLFEVLPKRDPEGSRVVVASLRNWDPTKFPLVDVLKAGVVLTELGSYEPATQISGVKFLLDMSGVTLAQLKAITPSTLKKIMDYSMNASPYKNRGVHFVKESRYLAPLYNMLKPIISKELKNMMFFHGNDMKSLHQHIPADVLPENYGGSYPFPSFSQSEWNSLLETFDKEFEKINTYGVKNN